jgi:hypothetical protein
MAKIGEAETTPKGLWVAWPPLFGLGMVLATPYNRSEGGQTIPMNHEDGLAAPKLTVGGGRNHQHGP